MSRIALTFAVLDSGGSAADLGYVFAANVVPQVLVMLGGGVLADRVGRRPVMLITDTARLAVQGTLAAVLFAGRPPIWVFVVLAGLLGTGEGFFNPALGGLRAEIAPPDKLPDANAMLERRAVSGDRRRARAGRDPDRAHEPGRRHRAGRSQLRRERPRPGAADDPAGQPGHPVALAGPCRRLGAVPRRRPGCG